MPVKISKSKVGYRVSTPSMVHAKGTTKAKAESQARLLRGIEHGWKPTGKKKKSRKQLVDQLGRAFRGKK